MDAYTHIHRRRLHRTVLAAALWAVLGVLLPGCVHKDLCLHHEHYATLRLVYDWRDAPGAAPGGMAVFFYPADGRNQVMRWDFRGTEGGELTVPYGRYHLITYNNDTSGVLFGDTDWHHSHYAFTREAGLFEPLGLSSRADTRAYRAEGAEDERVMLCPDPLWGCNAVDVIVNEQGVTFVCTPVSPDAGGTPPVAGPVHHEQVITLYPHELTCLYTYEVRNVDNPEYITQISGSLSGMAPSLRLHDEELDRECVTLPFDAQVNVAERTITGSFITFGHHGLNEQPHKMMFFFYTRDGNAYCVRADDPAFDVTAQVHAAPDRRRVHLVVDRFTVPRPADPPPPAGYNPAVDDWLEINVNMYL